MSRHPADTKNPVDPVNPVTLDDFKMILDEGLKVAREVVGPTLQDGDQQGLVYEDGRVKAYCSDFAFLLCREAIQVMGGVGYCREFPVEQYARDVKSASIYEGTTYIQVLDLVGRRLMRAGGAVFQGWLGQVTGFARANRKDPDFARDFTLLLQAGEVLGDYAGRFLSYFQEGRLGLNPLSAVRFLESMAETVLAREMLEQGLKAREKLKNADLQTASGVFYRGKTETVRFFCRQILTTVLSRQAALHPEDTSALDMPAAAF